jgi:hypothetical protein
MYGAAVVAPTSELHIANVPVERSVPTISVIHPRTRVTVPPTFEGCPANVTEDVASGTRGAPHAVQNARTPRYMRGAF